MSEERIKLLASEMDYETPDTEVVTILREAGLSAILLRHVQLDQEGLPIFLNEHLHELGELNIRFGYTEQDYGELLH